MKDGSGDIIIKPSPTYDFDYITRSLGLIPICGGSRAINAGAITFIRPRGGESDDDICYIEIGIHGGEGFTLSPEEMIELETTIKRREVEAKAEKKETFKESILAQQEVVNDLNNRVQPGMIVGAPVNKRGRN